MDSRNERQVNTRSTEQTTKAECLPHVGRHLEEREGPTTGLEEGRENRDFGEYRANRITLSAGTDDRQLSLYVLHYPQGVYNVFPQGATPPSVLDGPTLCLYI
jgi:hypothetical protein